MNTKQNLLKEAALTLSETQRSAKPLQTTISLTPNQQKRARRSRIFNLFFAALMLTALYGGSASMARADDSECEATWGPKSGIHMRRVTYLGPFTSTASDLRADADDPTHTVRLRGWLYFKDNALNKNKPVLIYNHGHDKER